MQEHHISSVGLLASVAGALLFLTFITIAVTWFDIPAPWNIVVAIGIAAIKGSLVALFFMNLWWDSKFNLMLLVLGLMRSEERRVGKECSCWWWWGCCMIG